MSPKLVEVALPLEDISIACRRDKDAKTGTIKNVHKWFAPMPSPAWRALLFATLVDDPGEEKKRAELLALIKRLVPPNGKPPDNKTLDEARDVIAEAPGGTLPIVFDPFCGGGSTLIEAQRLGIPAAGSDLNPVPVLITRMLTELLPQVSGRSPLVTDPLTLGIAAKGPLDGFLSDCRHYAQRVRDVVWDQIGHLYPTPPDGGTVAAWLWARTATCPNPACRATAPLVSSFWLSKKKGALTWIEPTDLRPGHPVRFEVRMGDGGPPAATKVGRGGTFRCVVCKELIPEDHCKAEGIAGRLGTQLMVVVVDGEGGRRYLTPAEGSLTPLVERPSEAPEVELANYARWFSSPAYGMTTEADLFTNRQLVALGAFADAVKKVASWVTADGGDDIQSNAIASLLGLCVSKLATTNSTQARWYIDNRNGSTTVQAAFGRHALPMVWDFVELNPFAERAANWLGMLESAASGLRSLPHSPNPCHTFQSDARVAGRRLANRALVATDPPYFAQIGYADLSDYFYVWLRRALAAVHPDLFATVATPKADELIAAPYRHRGSMAKATAYFVDGFTETFHNLRASSAPGLPMLIVYAHRQEESDDDGAASSTAWDAMLTAILAARLRIVGTWPIRGASSTSQIKQGTNSLATYMVLVCRPEEATAKPTDRQGFLAALHAELPKSIRKLQEGDISTIDLGPAAIGPGMAVFSRFSRVIDTTGKNMTVGAALTLISQVAGEVLDEFVGDLDNETRWAMGWFKDHGFEPGTYDDAEKLNKTNVTSLEMLEKAGVATGAKGKVRLVARSELSDDWRPDTDRQVTVWEVTEHMVKRLATKGETGAADLLRICKRWAEPARDLAQWLAATSLVSRPAEALDHDALVTSWSELMRLADRSAMSQGELGVDGTVDG
jgi:putative DNA methylase